MNQIKNVCVYSASSTKIAPVYFAAAKELGRLLAMRGINLINGAGSLGLMAATSDAALEAGGTVTGVIPRFMVEQGWQHDGLTHLVQTENMHERKQLMAEMSDGVIALPEDAVRWKNYSKSLPGSTWVSILSQLLSSTSMAFLLLC